ncbi:Histidine kinase A [Phytophthora megakarya]|uniref:histidine kinase n=1 Tax=Phytophthora megakarya TaxID=4795 RepID=A0A225WUY9_9STRA|nr:Histidine kinase A [Phytophthora megakarya]
MAPSKTGKRGRRASTASPATPPDADEDAWPRVQELFRMLNDANAPALGVRPDGRVALWNPRMEDITGFEAARVLGRPLADFVYGMQRKQEITETIESCIKDKKPELELRIPLRNTKGRNAQVLTNMTPLLAEDGACVGVYGVGQDVTEWAIQEKQYATVMMQANAPIIELDKEGNITVWNSKTASMTGYASVDMVGEPLLPVVDESFRKIVSEKIEQALTGIPGADFELPLVTARGSRVEIVLCLTPRFDTLGSVMGVVAIGQDVTERNTKEMEYRKLIETANAPIFGVDTEGRVVIFNAKAAQISEYSPDEVMGVDLVDTLISEEFRPAVAAVFESAFEGTETGNFEFPLVTKTGRKVEILLNATPRYDHTGKLVGVVGIGQDITDRIIQEKEYSRLIDTANAPIFGVDSNYEVIIWNKKAAAITEYTNEDTFGQELFKFISEDYRDAVAKVFSKALEGTGTANFDFPLITKSGRRLDILLNATPKYDHFVDANGCVNIWNRKAADTTQYPNEEVLGANLVENFIPEDFREAVWAVFSQALEGQDTANFEFPLMTKDGRRLEILLNATPRYNEKGVVIGVVGIGQDITIRMAQEQETNRLIHAANAPIFGVDRDGLVNIWNLKAAEITQYSAEEVMGKDLLNRFVAEEHRGTVELELQRAFEGEQTNNFDFPLITKTGRRVEILLNATPRYDEHGQIFGVMGIGQDITERIAQEQELIRLIDTANAPIFGVDSEGRVNIWNKKAAEIMQYPADAVMGEHLVEKFITTDYQDAVSYVLSEALNGIETANFEFPLITKTGRRVEILLNATPRYNEHGLVIGMVGIGQDITDRIAQEQEYMRLIDTANAPIFGVDSDGRVNIWNRKAANITQYTNEDVLGKDLVAEFISEEYKIAVHSVLEKAFEGVETANFEFPLITKSGRRVEILLNATPRYNEQGEVMGMVGIGQDITDRIAQEKEYMRLIDTANAPIFGVDSNGLVNIWNRKAADIMQYTTEDVLGKDLVAEFISNEYKVPVRSVLEKAFEGVETANFEFPLITKAGRRVEILLNATPRYNEQGEVMGMVGIGQDITDRIAQEQEYSRLIDTANAPIFGIDADMCVNILNNKAAQITNYAFEEVVGEKYVETFIAPEYQTIVYDIMSKALHGDETASFEVPVITKTGRKVNILLNATARFDQHGHIVGVVGIGQDITDRIAQEEEYARLIDSANAPIFGVDADGLVNIWNKKAAEITQYTPQDVMGENLVEKFITEDYREAVGLVLSKALEGVETANFEFPLMTKAGRRVEILLNATSRFNEHGEVIGMVGIGQDITDRIAQEKEYMRLIDTANAPIFGVDSNGLVNIWNRKAADIMQYTTEDVLGEDLVAKFISEEYRVAVRCVLEKAFEGEETANFEFPLITKAGRRVEILLNATPRYNEQGEVMGMVGIGQDITDRIAQEQEYSRLIDTANAPIFGIDANMCVNILNNKAAQITNYAVEEVLGEKYVETFIAPEYRTIVYDIMSNALQGNETASFEVPVITKTGRKLNILLNATARFDQHGRIVGVVGIGQDITDRIAQEQEYARLIDSANAPIFGVDADGLVNIWNKKAAEITQYTPQDVMGENLVEKFITEDYREAVGLVLSKALEGVETANFEFPLMTKAGRRVEILLNATSRFNEHGEVIGMVGIGQDITDRIAQEQEYSRLIDTANAPIFGVDSNGRVNIWNRKAADIMQYTNEDVLGKDLVAEFISKEYKVPVRSVLEKAFEGVETANFEFPLITKAGRRVEILLNATPRYNEHGEVKGMVGIGQDITERIAQEQEYSRLIDTANAPIFGVDANMCVNIWNRKAAQITNYAIEEVMGENLVETFISPEFRPIVAEVLSQALRGVETANFEFPLITRPGTRIEILLNATPRYDSNGSIVGVVGIGQDITDRIAQEHEYFRLIDTANAPIFGVDTNGCINEWNQKIEEITGYHKSSVLGLSLVHTFIIPESRQQVRQLLNQALIGIDVGEMELPMTTKRGVFLLLLVNASSKKDMHGNIRGVIGVGQDYTARKHMEAAKVNFLASFSHELRTPLNGVLGMLELLKEQQLEKAPERYVHMAYVSGSLLLNLINDILDLSKIEAGHLEISAAPFQMHELLDYSIEIFKFKARERGLKLELKCDDNVPKVAIGDVVRLRQVLLNLLSNAIKFTNEGSITVTCSVVYTPELPKAFKKLLFQVIDTGIGMDAEEKMRLFSLFTKLERTRQNNPTGSGLGLAICKQLAELMDGQIGVDSELDVGSNFYFTVVVRLLDDIDAKGLFYAANDLLTDGSDVAPPTSNVNSNDSTTSTALANAAKVVIPRQARILVAEDNEFNWEVVKCFLQEADHLLQWEVNGRDALKAYSENHTKFDLIFMDCEMPVMDGYTATKAIRQFELDNDLPRIPVLGLTAYAMSGDRQKCLGAGMDEFMVKPISKHSLLKAIRQWMRVRYLGPKTSTPSVAGSDDYPYASSEGVSVAASAPTGSISSPASSKERGGDDLDVVPMSYPTTSPTPRPSFDSQVDDDIVNNPTDESSKLAPASRHMQQLDLARAISNLELDDPMAIRRQVGPTVRTAVPTTSIFSLGSSVGNSTRSSGLLTLQRDTGGAIVDIPDWKQINKTSATLPNMKDKPLVGAETSDHVSSHSNPTLWSHPPFMGSKKDSAPPSTSSHQPMSPSSASDATSVRARAVTEGIRNENTPVSLQRFDSDKSSDEYTSGDPIAAMLERLNISSPAARSGVRGSPRPELASATTESDAAARATMNPTSIAIPEGDPVDYSLGVQQCGGQEELFLSLLEKFTVSCEAIMSRILVAYEQGDIQVTRRESHSLKGSSAYVAAMRVSKAAFRVQVACEQLQQCQSEAGPDQQLMALADAAAMVSLKQSLDASITLLKKEHRHLRGYLRRNFEFRDLTRSGSASAAAAFRSQGSSQDRANGPCGVM